MLDTLNVILPVSSSVSVSISSVYPSTATSSIVYLISVPFAYFTLPVNSNFHSVSSLTVAVSTTSPSANKLIVIEP